MNHTHLSLNDKAVSQLKDLTRGGIATKTGITESSIDRLWRSEFELSFNDAVTHLGITDDREQFYRYWQIVRDYLRQRHTLNVWQTIRRCYEWHCDSADEADTQQDALPGAS